MALVIATELPDLAINALPAPVTVHCDCGEIIYNVIEDEFQGGSGAGCSAVVFNSYIYDKLRRGELKRVLLCATGALLSTVSSGQGESIPCIAHAVSIEVV